MNSHGGFLRAEPRQGKNVLPDGLNWLCYFVGSSKSHRENSISCIFLESPLQEEMKNVVKCWKDFLWHLATLKTYCDNANYYFSLILFVIFQPKGQRPLLEFLSFIPVKNPVITKLTFYLHEKGHEVGFNQNHWPIVPENLMIDLNTQKSFDTPIEFKENIRISDCKDDADYDLIGCIRKDQNKIMEGTKGW